MHPSRTKTSMFGDFDAADGFHRALIAARDGHVTSMQAQRTALDSLAEKSQLAADVFTSQDEVSGDSIRSASISD